MDLRSHQFETLSKKALEDPFLQQAMKSLAKKFGTMRDEAFAELEDTEALRHRAHDVKESTIGRLDEYLTEIERKVHESGGHVLWASSAADARQMIAELAVKKGVKTVVKGKSMVSEEISLGEGFLECGIDAFETDLGEFILQLAGEPPSHVVAPALHKKKEQIAQIFSEKFDVPLMENPEEITLFARRLLRERFLDAGMGVTGANFLVAETGTIVIFENEGNVRLTTTIPRIHVAVAGIEKVIPTLNDLRIFLKILARSATGQKLPSYVSFINGPKKKGEFGGPEEFYLVLVDNGRSRILKDEDLKEVLYCIRCGACLNTCPVYLKVGGHAYGWVYSGPIGSILTPQLNDRRKAGLLPFASTLCGACSKVCPVMIDIPKILVALRRRYAEDPDWGPAGPTLEKGVFGLYSRIMGNRSHYEKCLQIIKWAQPLLMKNGSIRYLPPPFDRWGRNHDVRPLHKKPFRKYWKERKKRSEQ